MDARRSRYLRSGGVISYARSGSRSLRCLDSRNRCKVRAPPSLGRDNSPIRCRVRRLATRVLVASFPATLLRDDPVAVAKVDRDLDDRDSARIASRARSDGRCSEQPPPRRASARVRGIRKLFAEFPLPRRASLSSKPRRASVAFGSYVSAVEAIVRLLRSLFCCDTRDGRRSRLPRFASASCLRPQCYADGYLSVSTFLRLCPR